MKKKIENKCQCNHSWMQEASIKVCYHCGYKPNSPQEECKCCKWSLENELPCSHAKCGDPCAIHFPSPKIEERACSAGLAAPECPCKEGKIHCGLCAKPYACEPGMHHVKNSIEHPGNPNCHCECHEYSPTEKCCNYCKSPSSKKLPVKFGTILPEVLINVIYRPAKMHDIIEVRNKLNEIIDYLESKG